MQIKQTEIVSADNKITNKRTREKKTCVNYLVDLKGQKGYGQTEITNKFNEHFNTIGKNGE